MYSDFYLVLEVPSSETVSFLRPFFLRLAKTLRPLAVAMRSRKPCLFFLFLVEGWNVRFIFVFPAISYQRGAKMGRICRIYKHDTKLNHSLKNRDKGFWPDYLSFGQF